MVAEDDAACGVSVIVNRDSFFLGVFEDAFEGAVGGGFEGVVEFFDGDIPGQSGSEVGEGDIGCGDANGHAVEFAVEFGEDFADGFCGTGGGGDHGEGGGAASAEILHGGVEEGLCVGVGVDGGDEALFDAEGVVEDFGHGGEAVGGAGGVGDDFVFGGVEEGVVDAVDDG